MTYNDKLSEAVQGFLNNLDCTHKAPSTICAYKNDLNCFRKFLQSRYTGLQDNLEGLQTKHVVQYREYLMKQCGYTRRTADRKVFCFRKFCHYLELAGLVTCDPTVKVEHRKYRTGILPQYLVWDEIFLIIDMAGAEQHPHEARDAALLATFAFTGCRRSEALSLNWRDIDLPGRTLTIYRSKSRNSDVLPMHDLLYQTLKRLHLECGGKPDTPVFVSDEGNRLSVTAVKQMIDKCVRYANLGKQFRISTHTFRHSFVTNSLKAGMSLAEVQLFTGHRDLASLQPYIHLTIQDKLKVIEQIPA